jgi:hypothetical protein
MDDAQHRGEIAGHAFLVEFFYEADALVIVGDRRAIGGLAHQALVTLPGFPDDTPFALAPHAIFRAAAEWALAGGQVDKCTGFSVRSLGRKRAELVTAGLDGR